MQDKVASETKLRSVVKLISFKITEVTLSTLIIWITTNNYTYTIGLPLLIEGIQAVAIFFVERGWTKIQWGRVCSNCHFYLFHKKREDAGKPHD